MASPHAPDDVAHENGARTKDGRGNVASSSLGNLKHPIESVAVSASSSSSERDGHSIPKCHTKSTAARENARKHFYRIHETAPRIMSQKGSEALRSEVPKRISATASRSASLRPVSRVVERTVCQPVSRPDLRKKMLQKFPGKRMIAVQEE